MIVLGLGLGTWKCGGWRVGRCLKFFGSSFDRKSSRYRCLFCFFIEEGLVLIKGTYILYTFVYNNTL